METRSKTSVQVSTRDKKFRPPPELSGIVSGSMSLSSYTDYPAHRPFINTHMHHTTRPQHSNRAASRSKAFPETSSAVILSALRNLQEKFRRLELEKRQAEFSLHSLGKDASNTLLQSESPAQTNSQRDTERKANCNQVLITHLAAAESRCEKLERQLDHMKRMLRNTRTEKTTTANVLIKQIKIRELERKLQDEEHQRKLIEDKADQLQAGLESNRMLLQSVSPFPSVRQAKEKKSNSKISSPEQLTHTEPHYRLCLRDVPFVTGTSVGCSHSVRANVQAVLSLLKCHHPCLCNSRVLAHKASPPESTSSPSSSSVNGEELSELLQALQEELRLMSLEQDELKRQVESSVSEEERRDLRREQERLLLKMERKGEQISKLHKHKCQIMKLRKEAKSRPNSGNKERGSSRSRPARAVKDQPGERRKRNLRLLKDMKALQASLRT
uniref:Centrosomal protein 57kDa n=1 Tax=Nothobranchius pienaari TaxID=704102 RepID=A0A1A8QHA4_9TELE